MIPAELAVVIPARNEEAWLPLCLEAVECARERLRRERPDVVVSVTVALDRCTDGSALVVRGFPGVTGVAGDFGSVGGTRAAGIRNAMRNSRHPASKIWLANTDADTLVPPDWLSKQYRLAWKNQLVLGTVAPEMDGTNTALVDAWRRNYSSDDGHPHVHGANLACSAGAYAAVGGFADLEQDEDVDLAARIKTAGFPWVAVGGLQVTTSSRTAGRVPRGFSTYLGELA